MIAILAAAIGVPALICSIAYLAAWAEEMPSCRHCHTPALFARMGSWCPESDPEDLDLHDFA